MGVSFDRRNNDKTPPLDWLGLVAFSIFCGIGLFFLLNGWSF